MSLSELARNSFQSGISASKWVQLCRLFINKNTTHRSPEETQADISNSVLLLFRDYPGDPTLQGYLRHAIQHGLISLPIFVSTFLPAARSPELHNSATLDMLCRVALDCHYATGLPPMGSLVPFSHSPVEILGTVVEAMALLRTAYSLPTAHFHQLTTSASELLLLLASCVPDVSPISTGQAMVYVADATDLITMFRLMPAVRQVLENLMLSLSLLLGEDAKVAREAQMMHTLQLAMGKGDILGSNSDSDIVTLSLFLNCLLFGRATEFGPGDTRHVTAALVGLLRWSSWTLNVFCTQLLLTSLTLIAQSAELGATTKSTGMWRAFTLGRLPHLLAAFRKAAVSEVITEAESYIAIQSALSSVIHRPGLIEKCEWSSSVATSETSSDKTNSTRSFLRELLYQFVSVGLIDASFAIGVDPMFTPEFQPRVYTEVQEAGSDIETYIDSKLSTDLKLDDAMSLVRKIWREPCCHAIFAEVVRKRFVSLPNSHDIEALSCVCKLLYSCEFALEIVSMQTLLPELVAHAIALVEEYDCETVGDPQTAVSHLGDVVLFAQSTIARFNLSQPTFPVKGRSVSPRCLHSAALVHRIGELDNEDTTAFQNWSRALFDSSIEGIEDTILRSTRPKTLLRIAATLFSHAIEACHARKMDKEVLNNGISYFLGPLLNWTLTGVIKSLVLEIQRRNFNAPMHLEVLQTLLLSQACPQVVVNLSAPNVLRLFYGQKIPQLGPKTTPFDSSSIQRIALEALGKNVDVLENNGSSSIPGVGAIWSDRPREAIREALTAARAGHAPSLDVNRCLLYGTPSDFLQILWDALMEAASMGDMEAPKRVATFVLTVPRTPRSPPLLPIFLHTVLLPIVATADHISTTEQTMTVELLVSIISSSLTAALHLEWALLTVCEEERFALGQSASAMARRLAGDLRKKGQGPTSRVILQRLASSGPFVANFPIFMADA
ncbi:hypothetical protein CERSUDRAFT_110751 [Gelatoporia subvermispora B]|uniref:Mediator of RNA polymerase II transcription subunit 5 n=1 Tax=Ceriporiopsis subvermispora (strain B) TaxID=914234 RepID=M2RCP5_CERS8|nr:hypothetical protein CERSUDRAFT_110751 [Gelatoporia subvermispora B]